MHAFKLSSNLDLVVSNRDSIHGMAIQEYLIAECGYLLETPDTTNRYSGIRYILDTAMDYVKTEGLNLCDAIEIQTIY